MLKPLGISFSRRFIHTYIHGDGDCHFFTEEGHFYNVRLRARKWLRSPALLLHAILYKRHISSTAFTRPHTFFTWLSVMGSHMTQETSP